MNQRAEQIKDAARKIAGSDIVGNFYIYPAKTRDCGEDYVYGNYIPYSPVSAVFHY